MSRFVISRIMRDVEIALSYLTLSTVANQKLYLAEFRAMGTLWMRAHVALLRRYGVLSRLLFQRCNVFRCPASLVHVQGCAYVQTPSVTTCK